MITVASVTQRDADMSCASSEALDPVAVLHCSNAPLFTEKEKLPFIQDSTDEMAPQLNLCCVKCIFAHRHH